MMSVAKTKASWNIGAKMGTSPVLVGSFNSFLAKYWERAPTARLAMDFLKNQQKEDLYFDHFAFRTFGVDGCGIDSMAGTLVDFGYERRDNLVFKNKKLNAYWFAPPMPELPRIFVSELQVASFPKDVRDIIQKYTREASPHSDYLYLSGSLGVLPWPTPSLADYEALSEVSEYAAWTLVNGYSLNHTTISVHNLSGLNTIESLTRALEGESFALNSAGGVVKTSPDGRLRQISTLADTVDFSFSGGEARQVSGPYIEFAERLVLPQFEGLPAEVQEKHRRDGFEQGNADKIFESTSRGGRKCA